MSGAPVRHETRDGVTTVWLDRPETMNPVDPASAAAFARTMARVRREPSRVVIIAGQGRAFSAGGGFDFLSAQKRVSTAGVRKTLRAVYAAFLRVRDLPQVTIARLHGPVVGGGLGLALACDLRTVQDDARLRWNFARLGVSAGMAIWPLTRDLLGAAKAKELLLLGGDLSGTEFHRLGGAVAHARSRRSLEAKTHSVARRLLALSPHALARLKAEMRLGVDLRPYLRFEEKAQAEGLLGPDIAEGIAAVRAKRDPRFGNGFS